jgi:hypothetical protein
MMTSPMLCIRQQRPALNGSLLKGQHLMLIHIYPFANRWDKQTGIAVDLAGLPG